MGRRMSAATDIIGRASIAEVYRVLGGSELRAGRGKAFWRNGNGYNVGFNESKGTWFDYVAGEGGGILDLIVAVRGGSRQDALKWLADSSGTPLDDRPPRQDRAEHTRRARDIERQLPAARYWKRAAVLMTEELLTLLKSALENPTLPQPGLNEIQSTEGMLSGLRRQDGAELVEDYRWWLEHYPGLTAAMVVAAKRRERAARRALLVYLGETEEPGKVIA